MLNDPMDQTSAREPALPESLRQAVRDAQATGRAAEERAQSAMPFRARLRARDAVRPQPTLSILTHSRPITSGPVNTAAISEVRSIQSEVRTLKRVPPPRPGNKSALIPIAATAGGIAVVQQGGSSSDDEDEEGGFFNRISDFSQFAFAGLAVLGLAGLSVMAAENALGNKSSGDGAEGDNTLNPETFAAVPAATAVSVAAVEQANTPWFDYRGTADLLKSRMAALQAEEQETLRLAALEAEQSASLAIANAEAARVASEPAPSTGEPSIIDNRVRDRLAAEEAARAAAATAAVQLKADQAAAAAKVEADRLAAEEAARAASLAAEQQRLAEAEAARAAEVEAKRVADLAAKKKAAEVEAKRLADIEAANAAKAAEAKRLADIETKRLAALETERLAKAAEARRLADIEARRLAEAETARLASAAAAATAAPAPVRLSVPRGHASLKPVRPAAPVLVADAASGESALVTRPAPPTLKAQEPEVRALAGARPVDDFIAERAEYTAGHTLDVAALDILRSDFLGLVTGSADGTHHELQTPDGRSLLIHFERTVSLDPVAASIQSIGYTPITDDFSVRGYTQPVSVEVRVMCRDVSYAFPGQERGRFAACEGADGSWTMARASAPNGTPI